MLKVLPWKGVVHFGKWEKLNPRYVRPFKVLEKVGDVAYKLKLPKELSRVHNTFHVSNSKKCYADEPLAVPLDGLHFDDKLQFVDEPVEIMHCEVKRLKRSHIPIVKVKNRLGGRIRLMVSGGAPLSSEIEEFLRVTSCAFVLQGYGMTETCGLATLRYPDKMCMLGAVGSAFVYTDLHLEEVPDMGYDPLADPPRGEICDIGEMQPNGVLEIIDRKKRLIKLSQGNFKSSLVGYDLGVPNKDHAEKWAHQNGHKVSYSELCNLTQLKDYIISELKSTAVRNNLRGFEHIKGIIVESKTLEEQARFVDCDFEEAKR
ncbi:long chain acyl-CoA synthetase 1 [Tanacetum coccineum]|uniref:Long chain acyl-CoA synthetase 1 n=1 Tax=Tanacetum coccineum TaxID=301880 RepID=A0ABQ5AGR2_9ASTR